MSKACIILLDNMWILGGNASVTCFTFLSLFAFAAMETCMLVRIQYCSFLQEWEVPSSAPWGTHAKQGNPSRILARGLCHASVDGCRKRLFETAKSNSRYGPSSAAWGTHARQGNPSRIRARGLCHASVDGCRKRLFETIKNQ